MIKARRRAWAVKPYDTLRQHDLLCKGVAVREQVLACCRVVVVGAQQHRHDTGRELGQRRRMLDEFPL